MVKSTKKTVTEQIVTTTPTDMDQNPTPVKMLFPATSDTFREIRETILDSIKDPQANANEQRAAVDELLQQLQKAIDERNYSKTQQVMKMKIMLAGSEH